MIYSEYVNRIVAILPVDSPTETNFVTFLPEVIQDAENMCYRDLDPLVMSGTATGSIASPATSIPVPSGTLTASDFIVTSVGSVISRVRRADESLVRSYAPASTTGTPRYWCFPNYNTLLFTPAADAAYTYSFLYTVQPAPLSVSNTSTWLTTYVPDLFFAASMIFWMAYQKNFGAASEDPRAALSWSEIYQRELVSAVRAEANRKGAGYFDATSSPPPSTTATRGV